MNGKINGSLYHVLILWIKLSITSINHYFYSDTDKM